MQYGMYLSATGIMTASYRQDVISNNIANAETVGFKRDLALFQERRTEAQEKGLPPSRTNKVLEALGGGIFAAPTIVDSTQGDVEHTGNSLDNAIIGKGFFAVTHDGQQHLTRDGRFILNHKGNVALANNENFEVLSPRGKPINLNPNLPITVNSEGEITQDKQIVGQIGVFNVPNPDQLTKAGGTMVAYPNMKSIIPARGATLRNQFVERANVEPTSELAMLMDSQRQLEANANMIRYQDQMLSKLVNEVGKIS